MRSKIASFVVLAFLFTALPARADTPPSREAERAFFTALVAKRQARGRARIATGAALIASGLASLLVLGSVGALGFYDRNHDRRWFGEDGDILGGTLVGYGAFDAVLLTSIGTGLVIAGQSDTKGWRVETTAMRAIEARF